MQTDRVEFLEQAVLNMVAQALKDYWGNAATIFSEETDHPQDIAEDALREAIDAMGLSVLHERLYGKVDLKKAIYVFAPNAEPVALMLDAKAEHQEERTATIQMSQISMRVKMYRNGVEVDESGALDNFITRNDRKMLTVTIIAKFSYSDDKQRILNGIIVACIPNGMLQEQYNPTPDDNIWNVGRNAPKRGEEFRVRVNFNKLANKAAWRVVRIPSTLPEAPTA